MADGTKEGLIKLGGSTKDLAIKVGDGTKDLAAKTGESLAKHGLDAVSRLAKAGDMGSTLCVGPSRRIASQVRAICCKPTRASYRPAQRAADSQQPLT